MSSTTQPIYALYPVYRGRGFRDLDPLTLDDHAQELENVFKEWSDRVQVRGVYSTRGFRADSELMLWLVGSSPEDLQALVVDLGRSKPGLLLEMTWSFMGVVKPAEFTPDHAPAFVKGEPPKRFASVYPFVRTPEWYLLSSQERSSLLAEHGIMGREFPEVLANTTSAFGLGDWEWILAFEADEADRLVDCIRRLRDAQARRFTKQEVPFVTGIRKGVRSALDDLS